MPEEQFRQARILIIDDEINHLHFLKAILRKEGYSEVKSVTDPRQAVAVFEEYRPDIVLLDLAMPNMGGLQILQQFRALVPAEIYLPIIVVTADLTLDSRRKALANGAHDFILKPFEASEIVLRVANLLRTRFLHLEVQKQNRLFQATNEKLRAEMAERELAQAAFDQSNARYQCFAANSPGMVYQFIRHPDGSMAFPYVSEGSRELFALEPAEIEADANVLLSKIHPGDLASFARSVDESAAELCDWRWEGRYVGFPGKEMWVQGASRPEPQPDGSILWDGLLLDITERKRAEDALRESEIRFRQIADSISDVFWITSPDAREVVYLSPAYEKVWGVPRGSFKDLVHWAETIHSEDRARALTAFQGTTKTGGFEEEFRILRPDGTMRWIKARGFPVADADGQVHSLAGVAEDVTERRHAQEVLNRFFTLSLDMLATAGLDGYFKQLNPAWEATLGWTTEELTSRPFIEFVHPDDHEKTREEAARLGNGLEAIAFENRYQCKDGRYKTFSWNARADLRLQLIYATARDVTQSREIEAARRETEAKLHAIVDSTPSVVFIKDLDSKFLMVNRRFETLFGMRAEDVIGRNNIDNLPPAEAAVIRENDLTVVRNGRAMEFEEIVRLPDGIHTFLSVKVPLLDEAGRAYALCAISSDITERKRSEVVLLAAKEEAERANRAKSEFLSRMSHELRTPLNAILGFGHLLDTDGRDPDDAESVSQIMRAGRHLLTLIDEMLDISSIEAGRLELCLEPIHLGELMQETLSLMRPAAAAREVSLPEFTCHHFVLADAQRLRQVMLNLLSNAIKYNHAQGSVSLRTEETGTGMLRLSVCDTGTGISAADLPKTFTPFERLGAAKTDTEGIGLGLAISKRLLEMMGGTIGVESRFGEGSTFWIEVPVAEAPIAQVERAPIAKPELFGPAKCTLLYIEDNPSNLKLVERIVGRRPNMMLLAATRGADGLELARERRPDLILLDLHLPDMNGDKVLNHLVADPRTTDIPVVMVSADATAAQIARLKAAGARDYITKPLDVRNFLAKIDEIVSEKFQPMIIP